MASTGSTTHRITDRQTNIVPFGVLSFVGIDAVIALGTDQQLVGEILDQLILVLVAIGKEIRQGGDVRRRRNVWCRGILRFLRWCHIALLSRRRRVIVRRRIVRWSNFIYITGRVEHPNITFEDENDWMFIEGENLYPLSLRRNLVVHRFFGSDSSSPSSLARYSDRSLDWHDQSTFHWCHTGPISLERLLVECFSLGNTELTVERRSSFQIFVG